MGSCSRSLRGIIAFVAWGAAACGLDAVGTMVLGGNASPSDSGAPTADGAPSDVDAPDALADVDAGPLTTPQTCAEILARTPGAPSQVYMVDPDGPDAGIAELPVRCEMSAAGGGWTLVGRELANATQAFRYLGADSQNPQALADGTASGLIGKRFIGKYTQVWIDWDSGSFIRFTKPSGADVFDNVVNLSAPLTSVSTSDSTLGGWLLGGAKLCIASRESDVRPGDTSWAIKPEDDDNVGCGCSSSNWAGRGAFYSGVEGSTTCGDWGGGWAGVRDTGVQKGGVVPASETRIWIK